MKMTIKTALKTLAAAGVFHSHPEVLIVALSLVKQPSLVPFPQLSLMEEARLFTNPKHPYVHVTKYMIESCGSHHIYQAPNEGEQPEGVYGYFLEAGKQPDKPTKLHEVTKGSAVNLSAPNRKFINEQFEWAYEFELDCIVSAELVHKLMRLGASTAWTDSVYKTLTAYLPSGAVVTLQANWLMIYKIPSDREVYAALRKWPEVETDDPAVKEALATILDN